MEKLVLLLRNFKKINGYPNVSVAVGAGVKATAFSMGGIGGVETSLLPQRLSDRNVFYI